MFDTIQSFFDIIPGHSFIGTAFLGYVFGSIPFGLLLTRWVLKIDLRTVGSGNIGATNVLRTGSKALGAWTLGLDMLKGIIPVVVGGWLIQSSTDLGAWIPFWIGAWAVWGHMFPVWLRGVGGKGVATYFGTLLALDIWVGCTTLALWLGTVRATHVSSLGAIVAVFCAPFLVFFITHRLDFVIYATVLGVCVLIRHAGNIQRLMNHSEPRIGESSIPSAHDIDSTS